METGHAITRKRSVMRAADGEAGLSDRRVRLVSRHGRKVRAYSRQNLWGRSKRYGALLLSLGYTKRRQGAKAFEAQGSQLPGSWTR